MGKYTCSDCDMEVMNLTCGKCGSELEYKAINKDDGTTVGIAECGNGHGRIKSPMCHGHDMAAAD